MGWAGTPSWVSASIKLRCADSGISTLALGLILDSRKARSCWTARRWTASCENSRASFSAVCLLEKSHQKPPPINITIMIKTGSRPSPNLLERRLCISVSESYSFDYFTVANKRPVLLLASIGTEAISRVDFKFNKVAINVLTVRAEIGWFRVAFPLDLGAGWIEELCL